MQKLQHNDLDLKAHRCPRAMTMARIGIKQSVEAGDDQLTIASIEPMLESHITAYLNAHGLGDSKVSVDSSELTEEQMEEWMNLEGEYFDEDDFEMARTHKRITITFVSCAPTESSA